MTAEPGEVAGLSYPGEIRIYGIQQSYMGGGEHLDDSGDSLFAVGLYISPDVEARRALQPFAGLREEELLQSESFFGIFSAGSLRQTLLLHFPRSTSSEAVALELVGAVAAASRAVLSSTQDDPRLSEFSSALRSVLHREVPRGGNLFLCCAKGSLHIAYGEPVPGLRTTAQVGRSLDDAALCRDLFGAYLGGAAASPATKVGVASGYETRHLVWA